MNPFDPITSDLIILFCLLTFTVPVAYYVYLIRAKQNWGKQLIVSITLFVASFLILILLDQDKIDNPINIQFIPAITTAVVSLLLIVFLLIHRVFIRLALVVSKYFTGDTKIEISIMTNATKNK